MIGSLEELLWWGTETGNMKYLELQIVNVKLLLRVEVIWVSVSLCRVQAKNNRHLMKEGLVMIGSERGMLWWGTETETVRKTFLTERVDAVLNHFLWV